VTAAAEGVWALRNNIRPADFAHTMGWSYGYAYNVIRNRDYKFVPSGYGKFILKYGLKAFEEITKIANVDLSQGGVG